MILSINFSFHEFKINSNTHFILFLKIVTLIFEGIQLAQ